MRKNIETEQRDKCVAYLNKWIEYRHHKAIALVILKNVKERQQKVRAMAHLALVYDIITKIYYKFRERN